MATEPEPITIVLADDHAVVRSGLRWCSTREAASRSSPRPATPTAPAHVRGHKPDVLVLDLNMPGEPSCSRRSPRAGGVAGHARRRPHDAGGPASSRARRCAPGAAGYVLKEAADAELVEAVRRAAAGRHVPQPAAGRAAGRRAAGAGGPPDDLTEREVEVLRLIALGHTNAEIARAALPLGAHGRVPPRAHPAEAPPLHARRARALRARPRARRGRLSRAQASGSRAPDDRPGVGRRARPRARRPRARRARACRRARSRCPRGLRVEADAVVGARDTSSASPRAAHAIVDAAAPACLTTFVSASWTRR